MLLGSKSSNYISANSAKTALTHILTHNGLSSSVGQILLDLWPPVFRKKVGKTLEMPREIGLFVALCLISWTGLPSKQRTQRSARHRCLYIWQINIWSRKKMMLAVRLRKSFLPYRLPSFSVPRLGVRCAGFYYRADAVWRA